MPPDGADRRVVALARGRHGAVSLEQLAAAGLGRHAVANRVRLGWLRRVHRGVYLVGPLETPHSRAMAATLAVGDGALISHHAAAALWELRPPHPGPIDVTAPERRARSRPGIRVHQGGIHAADRSRRHGVPVCSPARTLLDLAAHLPQRDLDRAVEQAQVHHLASMHSLDAQLSRYPTHRGTAALRKATRIDPRLTRSEAERRLLELVRAARLALPESNVALQGHEVDFLWRHANLVVEVDGYAFHSSRRSFERDRRRDAELMAAGHRVLRVTWRQLTDEPEALVATLATALAA